MLSSVVQRKEARMVGCDVVVVDRRLRGREVLVPVVQAAVFDSILSLAVLDLETSAKQGLLFRRRDRWVGWFQIPPF